MGTGGYGETLAKFLAKKKKILVPYFCFVFGDLSGVKWVLKWEQCRAE